MALAQPAPEPGVDLASQESPPHDSGDTQTTGLRLSGLFNQRLERLERVAQKFQPQPGLPQDEALPLPAQAEPELSKVEPGMRWVEYSMQGSSILDAIVVECHLDAPCRHGVTISHTGLIKDPQSSVLTPQTLTQTPTLFHLFPDSFRTRRTLHNNPQCGRASQRWCRGPANQTG